MRRPPCIRQASEGELSTHPRCIVPTALCNKDAYAQIVLLQQMLKATCAQLFLLKQKCLRLVSTAGDHSGQVPRPAE